MDDFKKCLIKTAAIALAVLLLAAGAVGLIDPFFHYHAPLDGLAYTINSATRYYYTPGLTRHSSYNSIMVGSSVGAAFKPAAFKQHLGLDTHLATVDGAYPKNHAAVAQMALDSHADITRVFIALDLWYLGMDPDEYYYGETPLYLYDDNPFNDTRYLLNKQVLFEHAAEVLIKTAQGGSTPTVAEAFARPWDDSFKEYRVLRSYEEQMEIPGSLLDYDTAARPGNARLNLEQNLLPLVQANPQVTFTFLFPPVSLVFLQGLQQKGNLDVALQELAIVIEGLLAQPNAEVYFFLGLEDITANLYCFSDVVHFPDPVGERLLAHVAKGEYRLDAGNWRQQLDALARLVRDFDYSLYFGGQSAPTKTAQQLDAFMDACLDEPERYLLLAASGGEGHALSGYAQAQLKRAGLMAQPPPATPADGYLAVVDGGACVMESYGAGETAMELDGLQLRLVAAAPGSYAQLCIDGVDYSCCGLGLNIVLYDKQLGRVADSVVVEYSPAALLSRQLHAFQQVTA